MRTFRTFRHIAIARAQGSKNGGFQEPFEMQDCGRAAEEQRIVRFQRCGLVIVAAADGGDPPARQVDVLAARLQSCLMKDGFLLICWMATNSIWLISTIGCSSCALRVGLPDRKRLRWGCPR